MAGVGDFADRMTDDGLDEDEYLKSSENLTFDDMVSFTMFTEVVLIMFGMIIFMCILIF